MKLVKCYISSFGKIKNYTLDLNGGLNVIKEDNGWGKSTISMFIKAMFYGLKGSGKHSITDNERKKYKPWGSLDKFGGYVDFDWNGTIFRIERYFGNKESDDEVRIINLSTGKPSQNTENLGERIFGIDEDGFFSTTYFSEGDFEITGNTSLTAKYNSVIGVQSTDAFDKALIKVDNAIKKYKLNRGSKGLIEDKHNEIKFINDEIERANRSLDTLNAINTEIELIEGKINSVQNEIASLTQKIASVSEIQAVAERKKIFDSAKLEYERLFCHLNEIDKFFGGNLLSADTINAYSDCYKDYLAVQKEIARLNEELLSLNQKVQLTTPKKSNKNLILGACGGVVAVIGVILAVALSLILGASVGIIGIALLVVGIILHVKAPKPVDNNEDDLEYNRLKQDLDKYLAIQKEYQSKFNEFTERFGANDSDFISTLFAVREKLAERQNVLKDIEKVKATIDEYGKEKFENVSNLSNVSVDLLKAELVEKQSYLSSLSTNLADKKSSSARLDDVVSSIPDLESRRNQLREEELEYIDRHSILSKTLEFLKIADVNLKTKYREPLENSFNKYISLLSDGKFIGAKIDIDFKVTVEEMGGGKEQEYYSRGSQDLFEVCKRFALIDVLFVKERPFMILDDPFVSFDENKIKLALNLIEKLSSEYQIIYFVCHDSRKA